MDGLLEQLGPELWSFSYRTKMTGITFPCRSFVIQIKDQLLIISPGEWSDKLDEELNRLGEISWLFCPNAFHTTHLSDWQKRYDHAESIAPKAALKRNSKIVLDHVWQNEQCPFGESVKLHLIDGAPGISELAVYHEPSKSLILTDLIFNMQSAANLYSALMFKMVGIHKRIATSKIFKSQIKDMEAFKKSIRDLLQLDFKQIHPAHGDSITQDAREVLEKVLGWGL